MKFAIKGFLVLVIVIGSVIGYGVIYYHENPKAWAALNAPTPPTIGYVTNISYHNSSSFPMIDSPYPGYHLSINGTNLNTPWIYNYMYLRFTSYNATYLNMKGRLILFSWCMDDYGNDIGQIWCPSLNLTIYGSAAGGFFNESQYSQYGGKS